MYHAGKHATKGPHVERVIVLLHVHEELWTFEVPDEIQDEQVNAHDFLKDRYIVFLIN